MRRVSIVFSDQMDDEFPFRGRLDLLYVLATTTVYVVPHYISCHEYAPVFLESSSIWNQNHICTHSSSHTSHSSHTYHT